LLDKACKSVPNESILLSGGLDSSILLLYTKPKTAITIAINKLSSDYKYSSLIAKRFETKHNVVHPEVNVIIECLDELVSDYKTFDPIFLRNMVVQLIGFQKLVEMDCKSVVTGDGADELFGGYNFLHRFHKEPIILESKLQFLIRNMNFVSKNLAKKYRLNIYSPFLDEDIIEFAKSLSGKNKVAEYNGTVFGKYLLRKCFEDALGQETVWRKKEALESGSGMSRFMTTFNRRFSEEEFIEGSRLAKIDKVIIRDIEHLYYYQTYRKHFPAPINDPENKNLGIKICSYCRSSFRWEGSFCKVCGSYPV
jgi:asparagine synthase (glutamine-hydrolysing)